MTWGFSQSFFVTLSTYFKVFEVTVVKLATGKRPWTAMGSVTSPYWTQDGCFFAQLQASWKRPLCKNRK